MQRLRRSAGVVWALALLAFVPPATAYDPGTGTLESHDFDAALDDGWEMGNGLGTSPSPWTQIDDGADPALYADGYGPFGSSPTRHWTRRTVHPVAATSFSIAFEYRGEQDPGYAFDVEVEQRAPVPRKYRLRVDDTGAMTLWRTESGLPVVQATSGAGAVPDGQRRYVRFAIEADGSGHPRVAARVWGGNAGNEPSTWTVQFVDDADTVERVHRFELVADGPRGTRTWIDDLDAWGDVGNGVASSVTTIHLVELSHLDIGFTAPPDDVAAFAKTHLDQVLDNLDADPDYRWTIESGWWLDRWWERSTETERQRMDAALQEGRLRLTAGYANLHTTVAGHEELTRNLYWSTAFARARGLPVRTWITDDVPGSTFALPGLLARSGVDYYVGGMNTPFGGRLTAPDHGDRPFWWVGPDGSRVLSWITFDAYAEAFAYGFSFFDDLAAMYDKLAEKLPEQEEAGYPYPELMLMRGFDNHYQGFHARNLVDQWNATYDNPTFVLSTAGEFLDMMRATYGDETFPEFAGDFGAAWSGSQAGAQHTTDRVRRAHREGRAAEAVHAAASAIDGEPAPLASFDFLYRRMLEVDEHSGAGGWPGMFTPEEMERNNTIHLGYADDARDEARALLDQGVDRAIAALSAAGDAVVAVNPIGRDRSGWARAELSPALYGGTFRLVERATGAEVPFQRFDATSEILFRADVPPFGYAVYDLVPGEPTATPPGTLSGSATHLENDAYRVEVDPSDGAVTSLFDKSRGIELIDPGSSFRFNELASAVKAQIDFGGEPTPEPPASAATTLVTDGPLVAELRVTRTGTAHVETTYRLYRGDDRVEIENVLDRGAMDYVTHAEANRAYVVSWPFDVHDFDIRTETTTRFLDPVADSFERNSVFDWHNVEHALAFWDGARGVAVATDTVNAYHFEELTGLAPAAWSTGTGLLFPRMYDKSDEYEFEDGSIGPFVKEPGTPDILRYVHHLRSTGPSFDPVAVSRFGFEALSPMPTRVLSRRPGDMPDDAAAFFRVDAAGVLPYTAKPAHVGDGVVLRLTELTGTATTARVDSDVFVLSDPERIEQDEDGGTPLVVDGDGFLVDLAPYETATVRVRAAPDWAPVTLAVDKDPASGAVRLSWSGGRSPFTLTRAEDAAFTVGPVDLVDEQAVSAFDDPVLGDGRTYYYLAR